MAESSLSKQTTVLVIHSSPDVLSGCQNTLAKQGYQVEVATNGNEGLQKVYALTPTVIVVGTATPELNGYQLCRLLKNDPVLKNIPMLLLADTPEKMDRFWSIKAGADDCLSHDEIATKLLHKVQMVSEIYGQLQPDARTQLNQKAQPTPVIVGARLNQLLDTALVESTLMMEFRNLSDLIHDVSLLNHMLFSLLDSLIDYDAAAIFYNDESKTPRLLTFYSPEEKQLAGADVLFENFFRQVQEKTGLSWEEKEFEVIGQTADPAKSAPYHTCCLKEIYAGGKLLGALVLYSQHTVDYSQIFPVPLIENELRLLMKLRQLFSQAELLSVTDSLTGLFNHHYCMLTLQREFRSAQRYEMDLSLAMVGVDDFKQLNEQWGHPCGDEILKLVASCAGKNFRSMDIPARFGGKALAVIFPNTPSQQALTPLERFQKQVAETPLEWQGAQIPITVSIGLASITPNLKSSSDLIRQAEDALHAAKNKGRNGIEISAP